MADEQQPVTEHALKVHHCGRRRRPYREDPGGSR
jgi:hypothetical protein